MADDDTPVGLENFPHLTVTEQPVGQPGQGSTTKWIVACLVIAMCVAAISAASLLAFSIARLSERRSFDAQLAADRAEISALRTETQELRVDLAAAEKTLQCRAQAAFDTDVATSELLIAIGTQFATVLAREPEGIDAEQVRADSLRLRQALDLQAQAIKSCSE